MRLLLACRSPVEKLLCDVSAGLQIINQTLSRVDGLLLPVLFSSSESSVINGRPKRILRFRVVNCEHELWISYLSAMCVGDPIVGVN
jgi:hypothetical protein